MFFRAVQQRLPSVNAGLPVPHDFRGAAAVGCGAVRRSLLGRDASSAARQAALLRLFPTRKTYVFRLLQQGNVGKSFRPRGIQ